MSDLEKHFVRPGKEREFILSYLKDLTVKLSYGTITYSDFYYRVLAEPLLTGEEKRLLLKSPTPEAVLRLLGQESLELDGIPVPPDVVVVVERESLIPMYSRRYRMRPAGPGRLHPQAVTNPLKYITAVVRGDCRCPAYLPTVEWKVNSDALAVMVILSRLTGIQLIARRPLLLKTEADAVDAVLPARLATVAGEVEAHVVPAEVSPRFEAAVRKFLEDHKLEDQYNAMGVSPRFEALAYWEPWYNYFPTEENFRYDEELLERLLEAGLPRFLAKKLARRRIRSVNDVVEAVELIKAYVDSREIAEAAERVLAEHIGVTVDLLRRIKELI